MRVHDRRTSCWVPGIDVEEAFDSRSIDGTLFETKRLSLLGQAPGSTEPCPSVKTTSSDTHAHTFNVYQRGKQVQSRDSPHKLPLAFLHPRNHHIPGWEVLRGLLPPRQVFDEIVRGYYCCSFIVCFPPSTSEPSPGSLPREPKRADDIYQLQSLDGYPPPGRPKPNSTRCHFNWFPFLTPRVGTVESLDVGGSILERRPLHPVPYLPHQTVLESERTLMVEWTPTNPTPKATSNNPWILWTLSFLNVVVSVTIVIIVSEPPCLPQVYPG